MRAEAFTGWLMRRTFETGRHWAVNRVPLGRGAQRLWHGAPTSGWLGAPVRPERLGNGSRSRSACQAESKTSGLRADLGVSRCLVKQSGFEPVPPRAFWLALRRVGVRPTPVVLVVSVRRQRMVLFEQDPARPGSWLWPGYRARRSYVISTSTHGIGQHQHSYCTPLGLHRVARKIGAGAPLGTVFRHRQPIGLTWAGLPEAKIVHRILWLEGLEPGWNRGGTVDSFRRCIYIHGFGDEKTLGRPASRGCIHLAARDLVPLFDGLPVGTLVWIGPD